MKHEAAALSIHTPFLPISNLAAFRKVMNRAGFSFLRDVDGPGKKESPALNTMISPSCYGGLGMWNDVCKADPVRVVMEAGERKYT